MDKTADFACLQTITAGIVEQADMARPINQTIEMVGPYTVLMLISGQAETSSQVIRDKRVGRFPEWEYTLIHGKDDQPVEIQCTGFKNSHDLQTGQRFAPERDGYRIGHPFEQAEIGVDLHLDPGILHDLFHTVDGREVMEDKLLLQVVGALGGIFFLFTGG